MIKQTPSRNPRSRGHRVKHVLQICLLLGVCFWLIYQVKHSHDKKKEYDEKEAKISFRAESGDGISNLGRKGLYPRIHEVTKDEKQEEDDDEETIAEEEVNKTKENNFKQKKLEDKMKHEVEEQEEEEGNKHEEEGREEGIKHEEEEQEEEEGNKHEEERREEGNKHEEEEQEEEEGNTHEEEGREAEGTKHEEEEREEEERNKHEDEEQEEETKIDEIEDDGRGGGDDEIDERDQDKIGGEVDHEDDIIDEERGREEEIEDKERRNDDGEDKETQVDHETSTEDQDHDGGVKDDHGAREEQYNADDASSAVTHDTQTISTEPEKVNSEENENSVTNELMKNSDNNPENIDGVQKNSISQLGEGGVADNGSPPNMTSGDKKTDEIIHSKDQLPKDANDRLVPSNKSMDVTEAGNNPIGGNTESSGSSQPNETVVTSDLDQAQKVTIDGTDNGDASKLKTTKLEPANNTIAYGSSGAEINSTNPDKTENNAYSNSSADSESDGSNKMGKPEVTSETGKNSESLITKETADANQDGKSDINNESSGTDENSHSATDGTEAVFHDPIDSSDSVDSSIGQEGKEALIDLSTLPENGEGVNSRDAAAE